MSTLLTSLTDLYEYFDGLFDQNVDEDTLFASSYIRGFIAVEATAFGDDEQKLSTQLFNAVTDKMAQAKTELSPQDNAIVHNFWLSLQSKISA